ncbi:hypothetical protein JCGZ_20576 [Jatropha curcas]|uniref:Uncharacterized protein n=1 Tax=Jatropha curcas TaxID=180498 RepID=A0A067JZI6_JATCU|nr:hypothetical protein JCGZ_20576 [Jatropha curcas]
MAKRLLSQPSGFGETSKHVALEAEDAVMASEKYTDAESSSSIANSLLSFSTAFAFCGSILYMFGGRYIIPDLSNIKRRGKEGDWESTVLGYDFSRGMLLGELSEMKASKVRPSVVIFDDTVSGYQSPYRMDFILVDEVCFSPFRAYLLSPVKFDCPFPLYFLKPKLEPDDDDIGYTDSVAHTQMPYRPYHVAGRGSISCVGERTPCTIKAGFIYPERPDPCIHVETFKFSSSPREMSKSRVLDFSFLNYIINKKFRPKPVEQYSDLLEFDLLKSLKYLLGGNPCEAVMICGCFPV